MSKKVRVLVADDEPHIRQLMKGVLLAMQAEIVAEAGNGMETLDLFRVHKPDITLLDINMPRMDGLQTLKAIQEENPGTLVIMLSSLATLGIVQDCLEAGAYDFIRKDTPIAEIKVIIQKAWSHFLQTHVITGGSS
ncbi:MAG: response regulator [Magnetococcales bacterium]|nr:response regulator [Magnetococcales bacterium]